MKAFQSILIRNLPTFYILLYEDLELIAQYYVPIVRHVRLNIPIFSTVHGQVILILS